jgi:hypothetical protein
LLWSISPIFYARICANILLPKKFKPKILAHKRFGQKLWGKKVARKMLVKLIPSVDGKHFFVKVKRESDEKTDDECGQEEPAEVVGHQVVPLRTVDARCVRKEAQTVV